MAPLPFPRPGFLVVAGPSDRAMLQSPEHAEDPGMVKCEVNVPDIDPFGAHRVRPHAWPSLVR